MKKSKKSFAVPADYVVPQARLNHMVIREKYDFDGLPHNDEVFPVPVDWIKANASRFYFTNEQIIAAAKQTVETPEENNRCRLRGIYFLIENKEIVYVGQSTCLDDRIDQHRENGMPFDSVTWFEAPGLWLNDIEGYYIWRCNPILKNKWPPSMYFREAVTELDIKHGQKRNDVQYVTVIQSPRPLR